MSRNIKEVAGYDNFRKFLDTVTGTQQVNVYFIGSRDEYGLNWCPDCNRAQPHVVAAMSKYAEKDSIFLTVEVGDADFWQDLSNPFRKDSHFRVQMLPTLARWQSVVRLDGEQCNNKDLLVMFFTGDDL